MSRTSLKASFDFEFSLWKFRTSLEAHIDFEFHLSQSRTSLEVLNFNRLQNPISGGYRGRRKVDGQWKYSRKFSPQKFDGLDATLD